MDNFDSSCEPMEVDSSVNSVTHMDISYDDCSADSDVLFVKEEKLEAPVSTNSMSFDFSDKTRNLKIYHIVKKPENSPNISIFLAFIIVIAISITTYYVLDVNCHGELSGLSLKEKLHKKLYGQHTAVNDLIRIMNSDAQTKLLFFYGGTGVGKTYTVSLMLENIWNSSNTYHYTMPSFLTTFSTELMLGLTMCKNSIIVVDDLSVYDLINIKTHIKNVIEKSEKLDKSIMIILVFNCDNSAKDFMRKCNDTFEEELMTSFSDIYALKQFIRFEPLTEAHLKKCIEDEMRGKQVSEPEFKNILKNFNVSIDGCKGVLKKISFLNIA